MFSYRVKALLSFCSAVLILFISSCSSVKDEPMPFTQNNLDKYSKLVDASARNIDPSSGTPVDRMIKAYSNPMKDMGYDLDKTYRFYLFSLALKEVSSTLVECSQLFGPVSMAVVSYPEESVNKGLISQRTLDFLNMAEKIKEPITDKANEFLLLVQECQQGNGGVCTMTKYVDMLTNKGKLPKHVFEVPAEFISEEIERSLSEQAGFDSWGSRELIVSPDGQTIDTHVPGRLSEKAVPFIANLKKIELGRQYNRLLEQERLTFAKKS